ncbi:MAG: hypothetical protein ACRD2E_11740, partial [Terriglobales bacterium]
MGKWERRALAWAASLGTVVLGLAAVAAVRAGTPPATAAPGGALIGFTPRTAAAEQRWEARFQRLPDRARMRASLQRLTAEPH